MKRRLLAIAAMLCALPASGGDAPPDPAVVEALTPIDGLPSKVLVDYAFRGSDAAARLSAIASDSANDPGVQIRAIRMLPLYCPQPSCATASVHDALVRLVDGYVTALRQAPGITLAPLDQLRLRTAVEALGATRSGRASDVHLVTDDPRALLRHPSRDVRVTVVRALRALRSCEAIAPLQTLNASETSAQVKLAIRLALQNLSAPGACT